MAEKEVKEKVDDVKKEAKKVAGDIKEEAKKVYSKEDGTFEEIIDFVKNNAGLLIGLLVGLILVLTKISQLLLNLIVIIVAGIVGYYIQKKVIEKNDKK